MKNRIPLLIVLVLLLAAVPVGAFAHTASNPKIVPLWAGQHFPAGEVSVWNDGSSLHVCFQTSGSWRLVETHLYVGMSEPTKSAPGRFPYSQEHLPWVSSYCYDIPLGDIGAGGGDTVYIAAHAVVYWPCDWEETAWAEGDRFGKGWAMYFEYEIQGE